MSLSNREAKEHFELIEFQNSVVIINCSKCYNLNRDGTRNQKENSSKIEIWSRHNSLFWKLWKTI